MSQWIAILSLLASINADAGSTLSETRFTSCTPTSTCIEIEAHKAYQGTLSMSSLYFSNPSFRLIDPQGNIRTGLAESAYFDSFSNRLLLRGMLLGFSKKKTEAYYELPSGQLTTIYSK